MAAGIYNFTIEQGATFNRRIVWADQNGSPIQLSGYSAKMQIKNSKTKELLLELSTSNGKITLGEETGEIFLYISALETEVINWATGIYDLELTSGGGQVTKLIRGVVQVSREVTI